MLSIFICEINPEQRTHLEQTITNQILIENLNAKLVLSTSDPTQILDYLKEHPRTSGLYFLEANLQHEMDGFTLAAEIRERDLLGHIVFVTGHSELTLTTFSMKIEALDYIVKGKEYDEIRERIVACLHVAHQRYMNTLAQANELFQANVSGKRLFFPISDIMFFETSDRTKNRVILHLENETIDFRYSLKDAENQNSNLIRTHSSYVVNLQNIDYVDPKQMEIKMTNGEFVRLSVRGLQALKKKLNF
ncbi:MAG: LytTR family DNA-binding domain-containing protein [Lachnospiraceae bacterium]|nr:LytTR family DNA-binding domain-containing protein [Lachnospiraceae bacterium]